MQRCRHRRFALMAVAAAAIFATHAGAGPIYVVSDTGTTGQIYKYDNIQDMRNQTSSTNTGTLVGSVNGYRTDQGATYDYSTGFVYRINNAGNVFRYNSVEDWIANSGSTQLTTNNPFGNVPMVNNKRLNDFSYDGKTGGFYAVGASNNTNFAGDILIYDDVNALLTGVPSSTYAATYGLNRLVFWSREGTSGNTVPPVQPMVNGRYYQMSDAGRLEVFRSITTYAAGAQNRMNLGPENAFGGTSTFKAVLAFAVPVPEPGTLVLSLVAASSLMLRRRRR